MRERERGARLTTLELDQMHKLQRQRQRQRQQQRQRQHVSARSLTVQLALSYSLIALSLSLFAHVNKRVCRRNKFLHCRSHHVAGFGLFWFSAEARRGELCLQL